MRQDFSDIEKNNTEFKTVFKRQIYFVRNTQRPLCTYIIHFV